MFMSNYFIHSLSDNKMGDKGVQMAMEKMVQFQVIVWFLPSGQGDTAH